MISQLRLLKLLLSELFDLEEQEAEDQRSSTRVLASVSVMYRGDASVTMEKKGKTFCKNVRLESAASKSDDLKICIR